MKATYLFIIALFFIGSHSFAQSKSTTPPPGNLLAISWEIGIPSGGKKLVTETSLAGARFEYRKIINERFSAGLAVSSSGTNQYFPSNTYEKPDGTLAVTTDMIRQTLIIPITLTGHFYPKLSGNIIKPFIGIGLGAQYASQDVYYNIYVIDHSDWGFVARPEIGAILRFNESWGGLLSAGYNYSTNKMENLGIADISQVSVNIGLAFNLD